MKIDLKQLTEGKKVALTLLEKPEVLDINIPGARATSPIEINAEAIKIQDTVDLNIDLTSKVTIQCSRCLSEKELAIAKNFRLDYPIHKQDTAIDITEDIRQELMLEYPLKPLCKPDCKGLCAQCGRNLNEGLCNCKI